MTLLTLTLCARRSYVLKSTSDEAAMRAEVEARKQIGWNRHGNFVLEVRVQRTARSHRHAYSPLHLFHRSSAMKGPA